MTSLALIATQKEQYFTLIPEVSAVLFHLVHYIRIQD